MISVTDMHSYLGSYLESRPHVFQVLHKNDRGMVVYLVPSKKRYFINYLGPQPNLHLDPIAEQFEKHQPRCAIGTYNNEDSDSQVIQLADEGKATFHTGIGIPITRVIDEIIKMDWGMRVIGCFI